MIKSGTTRDMSGTRPDCPRRDGQGQPPIRVVPCPGQSVRANDPVPIVGLSFERDTGRSTYAFALCLQTVPVLLRNTAHIEQLGNVSVEFSKAWFQNLRPQIIHFLRSEQESVPPIFTASFSGSSRKILNKQSEMICDGCISLVLYDEHPQRLLTNSVDLVGLVTSDQYYKSHNGSCSEHHQTFNANLGGGNLA